MSCSLIEFETRTVELDSKLKARPFAPDSDFQERVAAKDRQLERMRAQADEVTKELEKRQETLEAMELRLRQAERSLLTSAVNTEVSSVVNVPVKTMSKG